MCMYQSQNLHETGRLRVETIIVYTTNLIMSITGW